MRVFPEGVRLLDVVRWPSARLLLAANLVPLLGAVFLGWGAHVILALFWAETAVVVLFTGAKIVLDVDLAAHAAEHKKAAGKLRLSLPTEQSEACPEPSPVSKS